MILDLTLHLVLWVIPCYQPEEVEDQKGEPLTVQLPVARPIPSSKPGKEETALKRQSRLSCSSEIGVYWRR